MIEWIRTKYVEFVFGPVFISFWIQWNMLGSGYFYKFYKYAMKDFCKQIKSEKIIVSNIKRSSKISH